MPIQWLDLIYENYNLPSAWYQVDLAEFHRAVIKCVSVESSFIGNPPPRRGEARCAGGHCVCALAASPPLTSTWNNVKTTLCSEKQGAERGGLGVTWAAERRSRRERTRDRAFLCGEHSPGLSGTPRKKSLKWKST